MFLLSKDYWQVQTTKNKGKGVFAKKVISKGTVIGDYIGMVVHTKDVDLNQEKENMYLMYYSDQASIYPDLDKPGIHLLNHSCSPNAWIYTLKGHTLVFAVKDIGSNEEITIDYLLAPKSKFCNPCPHNCKCGSKKCRRSFHLGEIEFNKWRMFQDMAAKKDKRARVNYGKNLKLLPNYPKKISSDYIKSIPLDLK